ncbi:Leaderpeptidase and N-methyltransferase [Alloalcanivorax dieselolei B5]|uniref:Prepilin leader peptidase/N-methyltransferase n=1 Tax=Alcanivorax dieselolei (strain DSM 16502 / CGMCC 1.3690 / MCCC 1A00001 / B-5) TaxID=930169 RepID=K0CJP1_ALCDB|nr:A24 family peptidase [Alloalcanivorax dieselolei]AFT71741.1 Leaderpeptidase and N-methyltransferase [Alloalcanivorax dieselolei B5]GGK02792.1 type 4 prepilin-like proteins leader peptide-processing enzyme [Alloalcanivorax dieselolei]
MFSFLADQPALLIIFCTVFGLLVGSFLNVVIHRVPRMMERTWRREAQEVLELPIEETSPYNLVVPRSRCPHCDHAIRWHENIPVISWLLLKGRCSACGQGISARYPLIELLSALIAAVCAWQFGYGSWLVFVLFASFTLLALAAIDLDTTLLPDAMTFPLLWAGLLAALLGISPVSLPDAVVGAMAGYLSLWSLYWVFKLVTGKEGMGYGDFKLLAALGAWLGWQYLPLVILLSSVVGLVFAIGMMARGGLKKGQGIPFGPYLAIAGWIALLWGDTIVGAYLGLFQF